MFDNLNPPTLIARIFVLLTAFTIHELAHAWSADMLGDNTPRMHGRLTLNPLAHLDPMGSLLLIVAGFGWAKPVPINPYALERRTPAGTMLVSLAGPASNLLMAIAAAIPFRVGLISTQAAYYDTYVRTGAFLPTIPQLLLEFIVINLVLMLFNLIPVSPLDGEKILYYFLPDNLAETFDRIRPYGPMIIMVVFIAGPYIGLDIISYIIGPPLNLLLGLLIG